MKKRFYRLQGGFSVIATIPQMSYTIFYKLLTSVRRIYSDERPIAEVDIQSEGGSEISLKNVEKCYHSVAIARSVYFRTGSNANLSRESYYCA